MGIVPTLSNGAAELIFEAAHGMQENLFSSKRAWRLMCTEVQSSLSGSWNLYPFLSQYPRNSMSFARVPMRSEVRIG